MKTIYSNRIPFVFSLILVLPFLFMELINRQKYGGEFPWMLFAVLWLLAAVFSVLSHSLWQNSTRFTVAGVVKAMFLLAALAAWMLIVKDQMPCFLGVYNCD